MTCPLFVPIGNFSGKVWLSMETQDQVYQVVNQDTMVI